MENVKTKIEENFDVNGDGIEGVTQSVEQATIQLKTVLNSYQDSIAKLQKEIEEREKIHAQKVNLVYQLKKQLEEKTTLRQELIKKNATGIKTVEQINQNIEKYKFELNKIKNFNQQIELDCQSMLNLKKDLEAKFYSAKEMYQNIVHEKNKLAQSRDELRQNIQTQNIQIKEIENLIKNTQGQIGETTQSIENFQIQMQELNKKQDALKKQSNKLNLENIEARGFKEKLDLEIKTVEQFVKKLEENKKQEENNLTLMTNDIERISQYKATLIKDAENIKYDIDNKKNEITKIKNSIVGLNQEIDFLNAKLKEFNTTKSRALDLLAVENKKYYELKKKRDEFAYDVNMAERSAQIIQQRNQRHQQMNKELRLETQELIQRLRAINAEKKHIEANEAGLKKRSQEVENRHSALKEKYNHLNVELTSLKASSEEEAQTIKTLEQDSVTLDQQIANLTKAIDDQKTKYQYSKTFRKNMEHIVEEKEKKLAALKFEAEGIESVVKYLGSDVVTIKSIERRLKEKFVFLDTKVNYLISEIPVMQLEKLELIISEFYNHALNVMDDRISPVAIIKNFENKLVSASFIYVAKSGQSIDINPVLAGIQSLLGQKLQIFQHQKDNKLILDFFV